MAKYEVSVDGKELEVEIVRDDGHRALVTVDGQEYEVGVRNVSVGATPAAITAAPVVPQRAPAAARATPRPAAGGGALQVLAPMPGAVLQVFASAGQSVSIGEALVRLEAMKMENDIQSEAEGTVKEILVAPGDEVREGQLLLVLEG
ncbi:MAG: biotin/lipoyl-containing protein [Myxococcota bacterium]